ncbi:MAG: diguanylate cyclase domain-containing protein [Janthinobacterium lividum]
MSSTFVSNVATVLMDPVESEDFEALFELAPVSLWLEDFSGLRTLFERWRAEGVDDLGIHLRGRPARVAQCMAELRVLRVNGTTLKLFAAPTQDALVASLGTIFRGDMADRFIHEMEQLWNGVLSYENRTVNYTLDGRRLDVQLHVRVLPGHEATWNRVMVSLDDVTARVCAERQREERATYAQDLFEHSPVSLWVEDFSAVKRLLDDIRARGISDFNTFLKVHPEFVARCMQEIRVIDVNQETLRIFGARDKKMLLENIPRIFRGEMRESFAEQLQDLWVGKTRQHREVVNYSLGGEPVNIHMQFDVLEAHLANWDMVLVSLMDITARKKAEAYLEYLGKHDVLTQLRNRTFYTEELNRLQRKGPWPVSVLSIDLNGLKQVNDEEGHAAGDAILRRVGEVLGKVVDQPAWPARVGGDEFAILLPATDERGAEAVRDRVLALLELNNQFYAGRSGHPLSLAIGVATCDGRETLDATLVRADKAMYLDKASHYSAQGTERRR